MRRKTFFVLVLVGGSMSPAGAANFTPLGFFPVADPPNTAYGSYGAGISADGQVVAVTSWVDVPGFPTWTREHAFRWTTSTGLVDLGTPAVSDPVLAYSRAAGISADGTTVVGHARFPIANSVGESDGPFLWTPGQGLSEVFPYGTAGFTNFGASGVSADGTVIVGAAISYIPTPTAEAWRFTEATGPVGLGFLPGATFPSSQANGVSADGSVVVGDASRNGNELEAFQWTAADGMVGLGDLAGGTFESRATGVSSDGSTVVGYGTTVVGYEATRWQTATGIISLGLLPGSTDTRAQAVSGDGSIVVGVAHSLDSARAFLWTEAAGMQSLLEVLVAQGATGLDGWTLANAIGISGDGQWLVGTGVGPDGVHQAFRAQLNPVPAPGTVGLLATGLVFLGARRRLSR